MSEEVYFLKEKYVKRTGHMYNVYLKGWLPADKSASLVDVGCGNGTLIRILKRAGYKDIQGVDSNKCKVEISRKEEARIVESDAVIFLQDKSESFDLILAMDLIEHLKKERIRSFLQACFSALKKNGRLVLQTPNAESPWGMTCVYGDFTHETIFSPLWLKELLELAGFVNIELRPTGPVVHGALSLVRFFVWKIIWFFLAIWNIAEKGDIGGGIYTRVFMVSGTKETG
ncbi:MAG: class I SAM-dependent methyltransferase [Candidatus Omnitrophica bacterium]|nr:class I SAM-dependent methyltransferase [Candidatus Omnitrophota bacterium]